jgi:tetratricopeptide (TPR) repeat protein
MLKLFSLAAIFLCVGLTASAQESLTFPTPSSGEDNGIVKGLPFVADRVFKVVRALPDGTISTMEFHGREARDSTGRILMETQLARKGDSVPPSAPMVISVFDPAARTLLVWNNASKVASLVHLPPPSQKALKELNGPRPTPDPASQPKTEDLGHRMIAGSLASGKRTTLIIPAGKVGNEQPITATDEVWKSDDLKVVLQETSNDPKNGQRSLEIVDLQRTEPDPSLFRLPEGYTVKERGLPSTADADKKPADTYAGAVAQLNSPDKALGAQALVKLADNSPDPAKQDDAAYLLARANADLPDAQRLSQAAVNALETGLSQTDMSRPSPEIFDKMVTLSRYWHTLGWVYFREGDFEKAQRYIQAAWDLEPYAYYGDHLGHIYEERGETQKAIQIYQQSLAGKGSDKQKELIRDRLSALSGPATADIKPSAIVLSGVPLQNASAIFDVVYTHSQSPQAQFVGGADSLRPFATRISQAASGFALPDDDPEKVLRRAEVTCAASCQIVFLSSAEAKKAIAP